MQVDIKLPKLFPWQQEFQDTPKRNRLAVVSRQAGKTTVSKSIAIKDLIKGKHVLWVAPTFQQLTENFHNIKNTIESLITKIQSPKQIELLTKGKIFFRSADNPDSLRGLTVDLVIFDEMAFATEEAYSIIRPMLSTRNGRFVGISTPSGHNFFHGHYLKAMKSDEWFVSKYDYSCSPLLTETEINKAREELSVNEFNQEYMAEFISPKGALFDAAWLTDIFVDKMPETYQRTMIGTDYSTGQGIHCDYQAICFAGWCNNVLYCDCSADRLSIEAFNRKIKFVYDKYKPEGIAVEVNFWQELAAHNLIKLWEPEPPPVIWEIDNKVKKETRIGRLATLLSRKQIKLLNNAGGVEAYHELSDFPSKDTHDDVLDAIEMAYRALINT